MQFVRFDTTSELPVNAADGRIDRHALTSPVQVPAPTPEQQANGVPVPEQAVFIGKSVVVSGVQVCVPRIILISSGRIAFNAEASAASMRSSSAS
jgi:hypothetical protein